MNQTGQPMMERLRSLYAIFAPTLSLVCIAVLIIFTNMGGWITLATVFLASVVLLRANEKPRTIALKVLALSVGVSALDYVGWRFRVVNWDAWWVAVPLLAAEVFGILHTVGFQYTLWPRRESSIDLIEDPTERPIFIFIPTVNEGISVLEMTIQGALHARESYLKAYPHGQVIIVICNDGYVAKAPGWQETERLAKYWNVACVTRTVKGGAKAGNIENARRLVGATGNALVVIFDADQIAEPDFLLNTIPPFADPTIGWVQTGQFYRNLDNPIAHWAHDQQALFYNILCPGKSNQNAAFICGTNVVLRAAALDEIGGLPQDSVTEDFAASIVLHSRWRSVFLPGMLASGLGPMTFKSYLNQQERWAIGTLGVFRQYWRQIFLPWASTLTFSQRIQYALACTHYLCGVRDLIYILTPIVFILTTISAVKGADLGTFLWHFLPYFISSQIAFWYVAWGKTSFRGILMGFGSFFALLGSLFTVIIGKHVSFTITSKTRDSDNPWLALRPHIVAFALCIAAVIVVLLRQVDSSDHGKVFVSLFWVLYTMGLLSGIFWLGYAEARGDEAKAVTPVDIITQSRWFIRLHQRPIWVVGSLVAIVLICIGIIVAPTQGHVFASVAPKFDVRTEVGQRLFGLTLPSEVLRTEPAQVERELGMQPSILGRVQDISDTFDNDWATKLSEQGQRPWVTLLFHIDGDPAYMSSLPAITNGVYDKYLKQWALSIREYGKPLYLTILPHVDRNWSLSSAVTNGGIPQDVPLAWKHVRQIFADLQADNVAWVWAPADPTHDELYAPPASSIDVTLLSMISYPQTEWVDPHKALQAVEVRYPDMPLFVEVSAAGQPVDKAAWLQQVGVAVASEANVRALLYHDGSPYTKSTMQQHQLWSVASDILSMDAAKSMIKIADLQTLSAEIHLPDPSHKMYSPID